MRRAIVILSGILLWTNSFSQGNCIPVSAKNGDNLAYAPGEKLDFVLHYHFGLVNSDVGTASVTLDTLSVASEKCFHCRVFGKTTRLFDHFFKVREDFNSWFTCDGLVPVRFSRDTQEGNYYAKNDYTYFWNVSSPRIEAEYYTSSIGQTTHITIPVKPCTFDLPSLFFFARNIDMSRVEQDVKYPMTFAIDDLVYDVYFIYRGKEEKKIRGYGKVRCMKFDADLLAGGVFKGGSDLTIYITDDGNRLPILFGAPILVGEVEGRLVSYSGLKHPFSSILK